MYKIWDKLSLTNKIVLPKVRLINFTLFLFFTSTIMLNIFAPSINAIGDEKPNIIMIMTDDQPLSTMQYMPKLKKYITDQGMSFNNAIYNLPLCCPTRASVMRGQNANNTGIKNNTPPSGGFYKFYNSGQINDTMGTWMQDAGYNTAFMGKYLNGYPTQVPELGLKYVPPGWDEWLGLIGSVQEAYNYGTNHNGTVAGGGEYITDRLSNEAVAYINDRNNATDGEPFFLSSWVTSPHTPLVPAPRHENLYPGLKAPRPPNYNEADISDKTFYGEAPLWNQSTIDTRDENYRLNVLELLAVDDMIENIVLTLEQNGQLDNTYIMFSSDNGYNFGEHRLSGKPYPYEENIRMPMVMRGPGISPGSSTNKLVGDIDLAPTFVDIAGGTVPSFVDGRSFAGLISDNYPAPSNWRSAYYLPSGHWDAVRTEDLSYIEFKTGQAEFYDLNVDPYQLDNSYNTMGPNLRYKLHNLVANFKNCTGASCRTLEESIEPPLPAGLETDAGADVTISLPTNTTNLSASVTFDGIMVPDQDMTVSWTGPNGVSFANPAATTTPVTLPAEGTYTLQFSATKDGQTVSDSLKVTIRPETQDALFVAGSNPVPAADRAILALVEAAGLNVIVADDDSNLSTIDQRAYDLIVISSSVVPTKVGNIFKNAPVPVMTWEGHLFDDMGLATSSGETSSTSNKLYINDPGSSLAAGLVGNIPVYSNLNKLSYGVPGSSAHVVASVSSSSTQAVLFTYENGSILTDLSTAPAKRIALFPNYSGAAILSTNGAAIVNAAIAYAISQ